MSVFRRRVTSGAVWTTVLVGLAGCEPPSELPEMPPILASSRYIDYRTDVNEGVVCMDDELAREDRFIEDVADFLGVDAPSGRIDFVWEPLTDPFDRAMWACDEAYACYQYYAAEERGFVRSNSIVQYHELVHAVDVPALGMGGRLLAEGMAEYLTSQSSTASILPEFPALFTALIEGEDLDVSEYLVAMHFVASLIERSGIEAYRALREGLPSDATLEEFSAQFEDVVGEPFGEALVSMQARPIRGRMQMASCTATDIETIARTDPRRVEARLTGACGDGWLVGGGGARVWKQFVIEVVDAGFYEIRISGGDAEQPEGSLQPCSVEGGNGLSALEGLTSYGELRPGRHVLKVAFPSAEAASDGVDLVLTFESPPHP